MFHRFLSFFLLFNFCAFVCVSPAHSEDIKVLKQHFQCLVDNISKYENTGTDPILIFLSTCPNVNPDLDFILGQSTNHLPDIGTNTPNERETEVLSLTKKELQCLSSKAASILQKSEEDVEYVQLPIEICSD